MSCRRYGAGNNKGGVGKTTLISRLCEELAARGRRVLAIDGDPQGNLSRMLGWGELPLLDRPTINEVVLAARPGCAVDAIVPCLWDVHDIASRIDLLPGRYDYELRVGESAGHEPGSAMARHSRQRLAVALSGGVLDGYDYMLMDMPPSIGPLTHIALDAVGDVATEAEAGGVLIPLFPDYDPIGGAIRMRDLIASAAIDWERPWLRSAGIVINRYDPTKKKSQERDFLPYAREVFGDQIIAVLHERAVIAEVASAGYPLRSEPNWRIRDRLVDLGKIVDVMEKGRVAA
jgi:cellulose biosynthesis protein BcsQ